MISLILVLLWTFAYAESEEIIVGVYPNPPLLYENEDGEAEGLFIDLLDDFAKQEDLNLKYTFGSLDEMFKNLENGRIDWIPGIAYSTERDEKYYFNNEVLFINWGQVYSTTNSEIAAMEDLINKRIGVQKSDIHYTGTYGILNTMNQFSFDATYVEFENKEEIFEAISNNTIDAGVVNRIFGMLNEGKYHVVKTPIQLNPVRMHLISLDDGYADTFNHFDEYLRDLKDDPNSLYHLSIEKWFGNEIIASIPKWLGQLLMILAGLSGLLIVSVLYARYQVKIKTKEIKKFNQNLEAMVIERTELIKKQQDELVETSKMAYLGTLVAGVAHEINTPIGVGITVSSHLEELTKTVKENLNEGKLSKSAFEQYMSQIEEGVILLLDNLQRAGDLVENFKQIAVDSHDLDVDEIPLKNYTEMLIKSLMTQFKNKDVSFEVNCDAALMITSYAGSYSQVLNNLIINSILHGFENRSNNKIQMNFKEDPQGIILIYKDNGIGLSEVIKEKIFEPFFTTKRGEGGSGLGMHIVYNVIHNRLQGNITMEDCSEGACFKIFLKDLKGEK